MDLEGWKAFFEAAGIPSEYAIRYATVFVENRVQTSMLEDLNKDYLKDMQITATGDVIAILKHAHKNIKKTTMEVGDTLSSEVPSNMNVNEMKDFVNLLQSLDIHTAIKNLKSLRDTQRELDHHIIERGYTILGEMACKIIDGNDSARSKLSENKRTSTKRKSGNLMPTPQECEYIDAKDLAHHRSPPTRERFESFLINSRETRHGIHTMKRSKPVEVKNFYDNFERALERCSDDETKIVQKLETQARVLNPSVECPSFGEVIFMKPYF